jgi:hypothetical protein
LSLFDGGILGGEPLEERQRVEVDGLEALRHRVENDQGDSPLAFELFDRARPCERLAMSKIVQRQREFRPEVDHLLVETQDWPRLCDLSAVGPPVFACLLDADSTLLAELRLKDIAETTVDLAQQMRGKMRPTAQTRGSSHDRAAVVEEVRDLRPDELQATVDRDLVRIGQPELGLFSDGAAQSLRSTRLQKRSPRLAPRRGKIGLAAQVHSQARAGRAHARRGIFGNGWCWASSGSLRSCVGGGRSPADARSLRWGTGETTPCRPPHREPGPNGDGLLGVCSLYGAH